MWRRASEFINCMHKKDVPFLLLVPVTGNKSPVPTDFQEADDAISLPNVTPTFIGVRDDNGVRMGSAIVAYTFGINFATIRYDSGGSLSSSGPARGLAFCASESLATFAEVYGCCNTTSCVHA